MKRRDEGMKSMQNVTIVDKLKMVTMKEVWRYYRKKWTPDTRDTGNERRDSAFLSPVLHIILNNSSAFAFLTVYSNPWLYKYQSSNSHVLAQLDCYYCNKIFNNAICISINAICISISCLRYLRCSIETPRTLRTAATGLVSDLLACGLFLSLHFCLHFRYFHTS